MARGIGDSGAEYIASALGQLGAASGGTGGIWGFPKMGVPPNHPF